MSKDTYYKSPMNYTGGKYKLLKQILPLFPQKIEGDFIDLFCGGCDVAINAPQSNRIVANDYNKKLIELYKAFLDFDSKEALTDYIENIISKYGLTITNADAYNQFRKDYNTNRAPIDLFILIAYSFNHQIRFNKNGEFNMPFGKDRSCFNKQMKKNLENFYEILTNRNIIFTSQSFENLKPEKIIPQSFVYCDPPYLITCATYNEQDGWNEERETNLYNMLDKLNERNIRFALSNVISNKGKTNEILHDWSEKYNVHHLVKTYGNCSYHAIDKTKVTTDEVLVTNY